MLAASWLTPSIRSPSEQIPKTRTPFAGSPKRAACILAASAKPTMLPTPCPSGPVVVSTPGVSPCSGCPGVLLSHWRNCSSCASGRS